MKKVFLFVLFTVLISSLAIAHEEDLGVNEYSAEIGNHHVDFKTLPAEPVSGEVSAIVISVTDDDRPATGLSPRGEILREAYNFIPDAENPGEYNIQYTFQKFGPEEFTVFIGEDFHTFTVEVTPSVQTGPDYFGLGIIAIIVVGLVAIAYFSFVPKKKKRMKRVTAITLAVVLVLAGGIGYSLAAYYNSPAIQGCLIQIGDVYVYHCHQSVKVEICGETKSFAWELGSLNAGGHTHKGDHRIHWHPDEPSPDPFKDMTLNKLFSDLGLELSETSVQDPKSKEVVTVDQNICNNPNGASVKVFETLQDASQSTEIENWLDYGMQDEAEYRIVYE